MKSSDVVQTGKIIERCKGTELQKLLLRNSHADKIKNVEAAKKLGIHAILFKNIKQLEIDLEKLGVKV